MQPYAYITNFARTCIGLYSHTTRYTIQPTQYALASSLAAAFNAAIHPKPRHPKLEKKFLHSKPPYRHNHRNEGGGIAFRLAPRHHLTTTTSTTTTGTQIGTRKRYTATSVQNNSYKH